MRYDIKLLREFAALLVCIPLVAGAQRGANAAASQAVKAKYNKLEVRIPMRDGVKLFTSIYVPRDSAQAWPIIMDRTPYGVAPYGPDAYRTSLGPSGNPKFADSGFIFVYQDARGRYYSEGKYTEMTPHIDNKKKGDVDESTDSYDTIDWLIKNIPHNNGRVAIFGTSYPGFYTTASCIDPHPALKACEPGAPMTDLWMGDDLFHNGAFMLGANFDFYLGYGRTPRAPNLGPDPRYDGPKITDAYQFYLDMGPIGPGSRKWLPRETAPLWDVVMEHPSYDAYWQSRDISRHVRKVPATLEVGGYYDAEDLAGPWRTFRGIERLSPGADNHIVVGPWSHGGWSRGAGNVLGALRWQTQTGPWFRDSVELPFYIHYLKNAPMAPLPKVTVYRTGGERWDTFDTWPPKNVDKRSLYLHADGKLDWARSPSSQPSAPSSYVSDPAHPVPVVDRVTPEGMPRDYMTGDQRFASKRADVLTFQTAPLTEDVRIIGPVTPVLHVSTSGTDADFDVKLIDVFPEDAPNWPGDTTGFKVAGYQQLVRGEPFRGRYRRDPAKPIAFVPGKPDSLRFTMPDINHTFRKGHRIMVQIQSSWFPLNDRNPQTFVKNIFEAKPEDFRKATMRVYHSAMQASRVEVLVLK
jgi:uncharacterized protein